MASRHWKNVGLATAILGLGMGLFMPWAAEAQPAPDPNPVTGGPVPSPMQGLGNVIRIPDAPAPLPPQTGTGPLYLPTAIPPNTVGSSSGK